jgi:hypothetical protein
MSGDIVGWMVYALLTKRALNSPEVGEAGDVGEGRCGPALGSQIATDPRKSPSQARSRACISARPRESKTGAVQEIATGSRVKEQSEQSLWRWYDAAGIRRNGQTLW